jgi:YD repeat-containing protein
VTDFAEKARTLGVIGRRTRDRVTEWRSPDGERHKAVRDELGNVVTQHARPNNTEDRQDVNVRAQTVRLERPTP